MTPVPEWPCPYCGYERWRPIFAYGLPKDRLRIAPVECGHCHVVFDAHWVDGAWMGRRYEANWPGALADFVEMRAETLRTKERER